ncbi:MAG: tRNA epoxyqueuosine(34) reductase QueG [bacterium]|nr:tRNA epoxyqueuosine(34) reductase QueG [bacterium]
MNTPYVVDYAQLRGVADEVGIQLAGVMGVPDLSLRLGEASERLGSWQEGGCASTMEYMKRPPALYTDFNAFLSGASAVLSFIIPYSSCAREEVTDYILPAGCGRVARYAWGRDYHRAVKKTLKLYMSKLQESVGHEISFRAFVDAVPLLERSMAVASAGFLGRNTMLILPGKGSYFFIAELLLADCLVSGQQVEFRGASPGSGCGSCRSCVDLCPTSALDEQGVLDARRCISYLTIEKKDAFNEWEAQAIGDWLFGCDICQQVCPFNRGARPTAMMPEFAAASGAGGSLGIEQVLSLRTQEQFLLRFSGTALMRAGRAGLLRNACAVSANLGLGHLGFLLAEVARLDSEELVRASARAALRRLGQG